MHLELSDTEMLRNTNGGFVVHGGTALVQNSTLQENGGADVILQFAARVSFEGVNDVGSVACEHDTVWVEGDVSCPTTESLTGKRIQMEQFPMDRLPIDHQMAPRWIE